MTLLDEIVARTRVDLKARMESCPLNVLRRGVGPSDRDFTSALLVPTLALIAEFKPRSPSRGPIRPNASPQNVASAYSPYAAAISVLCDKPFFGGGYPLLAEMRKATDLPLLAKDFVVDDYQVYEARKNGADAILLMVSLLDEPQIVHLLAVARALNMEALVETHDDDELEIALRAGARVVGVNSRDLRTLRIDLSRARERLRRVPTDCVRVAESGLETPEDVDAIRPLADAVLIGSSLMSAPDPAAKIEALGWQSR